MILQSLYQLAQREDLIGDLDFEPKQIAWLVRISPEGELIGIEGTHYIPAEEARKKKPRPVAKTYIVSGEEIREGLLNRVEAAIRDHDPCLSCSTHALGQMPIAIDILDAQGSVVNTLKRNGR